MTDLPSAILRVTGVNRVDFLQGLVTNDVGKLAQGMVYAALLTPQGKWIADFFLVPDTEAILIDVAEPLADRLLARLSMYKLRANVTITRKSYKGCARFLHALFVNGWVLVDRPDWRAHQS